MTDPFEELPPICLLPQLRHVLAHLHAAIDDLVHDRKTSAIDNLKSIEFDLMLNVEYDQYQKLIERSSQSWQHTPSEAPQEKPSPQEPSEQAHPGSGIPAKGNVEEDKPVT